MCIVNYRILCKEFYQILILKHVDPIIIYLLYFRAKFIVVVVYVLCCYALNVVTRGDVKMFVC